MLSSYWLINIIGNFSGRDREVSGESSDRDPDTMKTPGVCIEGKGTSGLQHE